MMKVLTIEEAVARVNAGENLEGVVLEEASLQQVNVRDAMVLARGGIMIPEEHIYYNDDDIQYDEDIDELTITSGLTDLSWEEKAKRAAAQQHSDLEDEGIAYDEAFEGDWVPVETDGLAEAEAEATLDVRLQLTPEITTWLEEHSVPVDKLLEQLLENFYRAEQVVEKGKGK